MRVKTSAVLEVAALTAVLLLGIASVRTFFRSGVLPGWDHPPHLVCSYLTSAYFFPRLLGWDPYNNFGWVFNQFYNPGAYLLVALIHRASFGLIDIVTAYKIALVVTYLLPALGAYTLTKALGGNPVGAVFAALLSLLILPGESEWLDAGLKQIYYIGMWPHRLGIGLALLALASYWSSLKTRGSTRLQRITLAAILSAGTILSHLMTGIALLIAVTVAAASQALGSVLLSEGPRGRRALVFLKGALSVFATFLAVVAATLGLLAFWLVPLSLTNAIYHSLPTITWYTGPWGFLHFLSSFGARTLTGTLLLSCAAMSLLFSGAAVERAWLPVSLSAVVSALFLWLLSALYPFDGYLGLRLSVATLLLLLTSSISRAPGPALLLSISSALLVVATGPDTYRFQVLWWNVDLSKLLPFSEWYAYYKFAGLARYLVLVSSSIGFSVMLERVYIRLKRLRGTASQLSLSVFGLTLLLTVWLLLGPHAAETDLFYSDASLPRFRMDTDFPGILDMVAVMEWVRRNVPNNTYVFYQDTLWKLGDWNHLPVSHYFYLSSMITGKPQVGGGFGTRYITHPLANTETDHLLGQPIEWVINHPERVYEIAKELGISYFIIFDNRLATSLMTRSEMFKLIYKRGPFYVFETTIFNPIVSIDKGEILNVIIRPNAIIVHYRANSTTTIRVRQVYFPGWTAYVRAGRVEISTFSPNIPSYVWVPGGSVIANYRLPFMKIAVPPGREVLCLQYELNTWGDVVTLLTIVTLISINVVVILNRVGLKQVVKIIEKFRQRTI